MDEDDVLQLLHSEGMEKVYAFVAELLCHYFRLEVRGLSNVPREGRAIVIPNHSGFAGMDVVVLGHLFKTRLRRDPRILAHRAYFDLFTFISKISQSFGLRPASLRSGITLLNDEELLLLFPEAEAGNFKSTMLRYQLQKFHTGYVKMAMLTNSPIIPAIVVGAEESNINLGNIDLSRFVKDLRIPLPLNIMPLPAKWRVKFMKPVRLEQTGSEAAADDKLVQKISDGIQDEMQAELSREVRGRKYVFFKPV